jgi:hypothetical protein
VTDNTGIVAWGCRDRKSQERETTNGYEETEGFLAMTVVSRIYTNVKTYQILSVKHM